MIERDLFLINLVKTAGKAGYKASTGSKAFSEKFDVTHNIFRENLNQLQKKGYLRKKYTRPYSKFSQFKPGYTTYFFVRDIAQE